MKILLMMIAALFSLPILLIAGFQLIRLIAIELTNLVAEAWRNPGMRSSN